jgi:hypothetical protein
MVETTNTGITRTGRFNTSRLLGALIVSGCLVVAAPVYAGTDAEQMKAMQDKLDNLENQLSQLTSGMASHSTSGEGLPIHGFTDVGFASNSNRDPATADPSGFNVGSLSFYLAPHFGDRVKALVEPNFEVPPDGSIAVDLERVQIGYTFSDTATAWTGRFHSPYGYWNTGFHHGALMQTSVLRPRFLDFEDKGGILPAHMVGLWGTGKVRAGSGKFTYDVYAGNGPKIVDAGTGAGVLDINQAGDDNHQAMVGFNLGYEFSGSVDGLRLAIHGLRGDVADNIPNNTELNMVGGSAVYLANDWEVMGEYYGFNDKDKSGSSGTHKSWADYLQIGKSFNDLTPYVRFERTVLSQLDNYFNLQASGQSYARQALGLRYNLSQKAALKFELVNSSFKEDLTGAIPRTALGYRSFYAQYAIGF